MKKRTRTILVVVAVLAFMALLFFAMTKAGDAATIRADVGAEASAATAAPLPAGEAALAPLPLIATGAYHTCRVDSTGHLVCYGDNSAGELGNGTTTNSVTPVQVVGLPTPILEVAAHYDRTCALVAGPKLYCWGRAATIQNGKPVSSTIPVKISGLPAGAHGLAVGQTDACLLDTGGTVWCWGLNDRGQVGDGTTKPRPAPVKTKAPQASKVVASDSYACSVAKSGAGVTCWGRSHGSDGDPLNPEGLVVNSVTPVAIAGLADAVDVAATGDFACATMPDRSVQCWGENDHGQLADGTVTGRPTPETVPGLPPSAQVVASANHACSLDDAGAVMCWGRGDHGQMGNGTWADSDQPVAVQQPGPVTHLWVGASGHWTLALAADGTAFGWGRDQYGQLGDGGTTDEATPVPVPLT